MSITSQTHTTIATLQKMLVMPGQIDIHVHHLRGIYVPFVFHTAPGSQKMGYGPIMTEDKLVGNANLELLIEALHESLGNNIRIFGPDVDLDNEASPNTLH